MPLGQAVVEEEEGWLLATLMATAMPLAIAMPLATALRMALVRCFVVVAVSAVVVVVERLAFRVVAGMVERLAYRVRLPWRLVAAQWQPWRLWWRLPLGFGSPAKSNCDLSPLTGGTTPPRRAQNHWVKPI